AFQNGLALRAVLQMALEFRRPHRIQLAVKITVNCGLCQFAVHDASFAAAPAAPVKVCRKRSRARDNVDITVPMGIPVISPISLYEQPSNSLSTSTSLKRG